MLEECQHPWWVENIFAWGRRLSSQSCHKGHILLRGQQRKRHFRPTPTHWHQYKDREHFFRKHSCGKQRVYSKCFKVWAINVSWCVYVYVFDVYMCVFSSSFVGNKLEDKENTAVIIYVCVIRNYCMCYVVSHCLAKRQALWRWVFFMSFRPSVMHVKVYLQCM